MNEFEGGLIDRNAPDALRCWSRMLGVSQSEVLIAVAVVGNRAECVRDYLDQTWPAPLA
ncbi:DUF3606 domain-containing protein [Sphingopyxis sp. KK2]|uniref:DUF3606 domain-containing protein n=1 Tax=Sphingopyxis sp. KK2 TaxID=1855727 RepID=UPI0009F83D3F|nr:DUF3606 domain-containing protein [Sphingopyxis sp. KK2]